MAAAARPAPAENVYAQFLDRYSSDWVLLVREVLGAEPDPYQAELLEAACRGERRISIRSGHGVGKTTALAWCIVCHALTRFPQKTVCTAPTAGQLFDALAAETKTWLSKLPAALQELFDVTTDTIRFAPAPSESFVTYATSRAETPEALAGKHSAHVLLIADEASGVPEQVFEAAVGSMSGHGATTILAGNPVRTTGLFWKTHNDSKVMADWRRIHVSCLDVPHRVSPDFVRQVAATYGERSNAYRVRVLGEFPLADTDTVIPFELVESALKRDVRMAPFTPEVWGLDCARFGDDDTALARRRGKCLVRPVETKHGLDTMQIVGWVKSEYDAMPITERPAEINVDVIGLGAGVVDRGRELGLPIRGINVSEAPAMKGEYLNQRAELWFRGHEFFAARDCNVCGDDLLLAELVAVRFKYTSSGKKQVESKDEMKKRGVPSPNRADAFLLTLASDAIAAAHGSKAGASWSQPLKRGIKGIV